jgi:uncharacterized protein (UPF0147 family)
MALGPINYQMQVATPFESVLRGVSAGAQLANVEMARQQQAVQIEAQRQKAALEQQAADRAAANEAELQELQSIPLDQMNQAQQLRLMELNRSEVTRAFIARQIEQMPANVLTNRMRGYASIVNALMMNPEVGVRRLRTLAEAETDAAEKKALETAAQIAETNPLFGARMIHGIMAEIGATNKEVQGYADAVVNFLERSSKPLYPKEPGKPMVVGGSVFMPDTREFLQPPRQSQLLPPEEEAQKVRIAAAGRTPPAPREEKDDPRTVVAFRETDAAGNVTLLNKFGQIITPTAPVRGKPSATFEKTTAQRKQLQIDISNAIKELEEITEPGGLIDQSTGSGFGRGIDISAGFIGRATPGAIAIGKLQPIADMVLKMVPRFEGPQSDKDTRSYKEAAGQLADATLPNKIRKQAALEITRLMKNRKSQFVTAEMAAEGVGAAPAPSAAKPLTAAEQTELDALRQRFGGRRP